MKKRILLPAFFLLLLAVSNSYGQRDTLRPGIIPIDKGPIVKPGIIPRDVIYVKWNARGRNDGTSWSNAYRDLQNALEVATAGKVIWVAAGTYRPTATVDRNISFRMKNRVSMYGGFNGTETNFGLRNSKVNQVILDGNIGDPSVSIDNSYSIVYIEGVDSLTVLDGFVIQHANADQSTSQVMVGSAGGGIYIEGSTVGTSPVIKNCLIRYNKANRGGGVVITRAILAGRAGGGNPSFINCKFDGNSAAMKGGAIYIDSYWRDFNPRFTDCRFENNLAMDAGGAVYQYVVNANSAPVYKGCQFSFNNARNGAAISMELLPREPELASEPIIFTPVLENCVFANNGMEGGHSGQGTVASNIHATSVLKVLNCLFEYRNYFARSSFRLMGGAFYNKVHGRGNFTLQVINSIFSKLKCDGDGGVLYNICDQNARLENRFINCLFSQNVGCRGGVVAAFNLDSLSENITGFYNCIFYNNYFRPPAPTISCGLGQDFYLHDERSRVQLFSCLTNKANCELVKGGRGTAECTDMVFLADPLFRNIERNDLRLFPHSPAINAGSNGYVSGIMSDYSGAPRIRAKRVDIGPYEH